MRFTTKILLAATFLLAGLAHADVTASDSQAANFAPASDAPKTESADQSALDVKEEIADQVTEGASCQLLCHPVSKVNTKTSLAHIDLGKIK